MSDLTLESILAKKWEAGSDPHEIRLLLQYKWSDKDKQSISCPAEIRDLVIEMQNCLHQLYRNKQEKKSEAEAAETLYNEALGKND